jgi:hypothetical protein
MSIYRLTGRKLREWTRRYLPGEIAGTTCEMGGAAITYAMTGSLTASALAATIGACVGWYAAVYVAAVRTAYRAQRAAAVRSRMLVANALALRSIVVEFGPAEVLDSLFVRPLAFYYGPILFDGNVAGWIFAKLVADVGFYSLSIVSYERFNRLLVVRRNVEGVNHEPSAAVAAA